MNSGFKYKHKEKEIFTYMTEKTCFYIHKLKFSSAYDHLILPSFQRAFQIFQYRCLKIHVLKHLCLRIYIYKLYEWLLRTIWIFISSKQNSCQIYCRMNFKIYLDTLWRMQSLCTSVITVGYWYYLIKGVCVCVCVF